MDKFKIDSHKLIYHVGRVHRWLEGEKIYPIYMEIGLFGGCNHRCVFCALDFLKYKPHLLDRRCLMRFVREAAVKGVKAILYSGEGEPLLHKDACAIIEFTKKQGIDVALSSNGVFLDKAKSAAILPFLTWVKFSLDAGTSKTYAEVHRTAPRDFKAVVSNISDAVRLKDRHRYGCVIGAQYLLIPHNYREVIATARLLRDLGVDYFVVKPYSPHPSSTNRIRFPFRYSELFYLQDKLEKLSKGNFQVVFRRRAMEKTEQAKPYARCLGLPFIGCIMADGNVYPCNIFLGKAEFAFGNIYRESFARIWEGRRRKRIMDFVYRRWDIGKCRKSCRLDEINRYLWELRHPAGHVNFI